MVEAATGRVPFATDTTLGTLMARIEQPIDVGADLGPLTSVLEAAGTIDPADRLDAAGLVEALRELVDRVPPPARLPLVNPVGTGVSERDGDPTAIPGGRPVPFDIDRVSPAAPTGDNRPRSDTLGSANHLPAGNRLPADDHDSARKHPITGSGLRAVPAPVAGIDADLDPAHDSRHGGRAPRPRRRRRAIILAVTVVVVAAAVAVGLALRPRPTHRVPTLQGNTELAARQALRPLHLGLRVGGRVYDGTAPSGTVIAQRPATGRASEGSSVAVVLSKGPPAGRWARSPRRPR